MLLVEAFLTSIPAQMVADTDWLAHVTAGDTDVGLALITGTFTPSTDLAIGDLTFAAAGTFDKPTTILCASETQSVIVDTDGNPGIMLDEPAGGFTWRTDDAGLIPVTVYGVALVRASAGVPTVLYATAILASPIELNIVGQTIQVSSKIGFFVDPLFVATIDVIGPG